MSHTKDALMLVLDGGASMEADFLEQAKCIIRRLLGKMFVSGGQHEVALLAFGMEETDNALYTEGDDYKGVLLLQQFQKPSLSLLESVDELSCSELEGDSTDALVVSVHTLVQYVRKRKFNKRVFLLTGGAGTIRDPEQIEQIAEVFKTNEIALNIIGFGFQADESTEPRSENERLLRSLADASDGLVVTESEADKIIGYFRAKKTKSMAKFKGFLSIGESLKIKVTTFAKSKVSHLPSLKKDAVLMKRGEDNNAEGVEASLTQVREAVVRKSIYRNEVTDTEVVASDRVKSFYYGKTLVPVSDIDETVLRWRGSQCLSVLGFTSRANVKREHFLEETDVCLPAKDCPESATAFAAFVQVMREQDLAAILRYVKKDNASPVLGCLTPSLEDDAVMYLNHLPFSEDIRRFDFPSISQNPKNQVTDDRKRTTRAIIKALDLSRAARDEDGEAVEALRPETTFNPVFQRYFQALDKRLLDEEADISSIDPRILKYFEPEQELFDQASEALNAFEAQFELIEIEDPKKKTGIQRHWRDNVAAVESGIEESQAESVKIEDVMSVRITKIGLTNPVEDFIRMTTDKSQLPLATMQMLKAASSLVEHSYQGNKYEMAMRCIACCRSACIESAEFVSFNSGLQNLADRVRRRDDFWSLLVEKQLSLIDNGEVNDSDVSPEQAAVFLQANEEQQPIAEKVAPPEEMFDGFED